jgi:hypothetical protein
VTDTDGRTTTESGARRGDLLRDLAADVGLGAAWAALITAAVLFSGVVLQFTYVDF